LLRVLFLWFLGVFANYVHKRNFHITPAGDQVRENEWEKVGGVAWRREKELLT
jgi:hypothetical protein